MKQSLTMGMFVAALALSGCDTTEKYGDARLVTGKTLFGGTTYTLNSPKFRVGKEKEYLFEYRNLPFPALPNFFTVVGYRWPFSNEANEPPSYAQTKYRVQFEDLDGTVFFTTTFTLAIFEENGKKRFVPCANLYELGKNPKPRQTYNVRVTVLKPSTRRWDKAYLFSSSMGTNGLY